MRRIVEVWMLVAGFASLTALGGCITLPDDDDDQSLAGEVDENDSAEDTGEGEGEGEEVVEEGPYADIPADPDVEPPAEIPEEERNLSVSFSAGLELSDDNAEGDRIQLVLNALLDPGANKPILDLVPYNEVIVQEGDVVKGVKVQMPDDIEGSTSVGADIVFIIDTTGSMSGAIEGVKASVNEFASYLGSEGFAVRLGAIAYGDYAPLNDNPYFDASYYEGLEPYIDLTTDFGSEATTFNTFVNGLGASYMGDGGGDGPENPLDAIMYADAHFDWNSGAAKIFVLLTDITAHVDGDPTDEYSNFTDHTMESVVAELLGDAVVHVVSQNFYTGCYVYSAEEFDAFFECIESDPTYMPVEDYGDCKDLADGTGGLWYPMPGDGRVDLKVIPLTETISAAHVITFVSEDPSVAHDLRVWVEVEGRTETLKGEFTIEGITYE